MAAEHLDALDVTLLRLLDEHPRAGVLELSRLAGVARATVTARMERLHANGIVRGYGPEIDLAAAGYTVQALATLEIAQGRLADVTALLTSLPGVVEAYATTGTGDVVCRLAAASNEDLQELLLALNKSAAIRRSTSVVILSQIVAPRTLPLLMQEQRPAPHRAPGYRRSVAPQPARDTPRRTR
jgi:DNA-binding Lrp family transcriptional regulator